MIFEAVSYLKFLWRSTNQHGVHSPFVFDLVTKCFYDGVQYPEYELLANHRKRLLADKNFISVADFGAGSRVFKSNERQISAIAKNAGINEKRARLLFRICRYFKPGVILELGTSVGLGTYPLFLGNPQAQLISVEGCTKTASIARKYLPEIDVVVSRFSSFLQNKPISKNLDSWQLVYFDGNHQKQPTLDYFEALLPTVTEKTVWIFDDIHWSKAMQQAWEIIKNRPEVTVTIDTFDWGFVFFRTDQAKEHFTIRV